MHIDRQNAANPSQSLAKQRHDLQMELDLLTTTDAEQLILRFRATYYKYGEKPTRLWPIN